MGFELAIIFIAILLFSIILHEVAHGAMAYIFGDHTAKEQGRLTLNPLPHIDMLGSILIPAALVLFGSGILFGWAKPVPYNPYNLKTHFAETLVAAAGILTNLAIAIVAAIPFWFLGVESLSAIADILVIIITVNLFLAVLNAIPIPPLDGAKIISSALPAHMRNKLQESVGRIIDVNSIAFLILVLLGIFFFGLPIIVSAVYFLTALLTGGAAL